jgi:hypothetical protein
MAAFVSFDVLMLSSPYPEKRPIRLCFLVISGGNMASAWSHYYVTEGGVT